MLRSFFWFLGSQTLVNTPLSFMFEIVLNSSYGELSRHERTEALIKAFEDKANKDPNFLNDPVANDIYDDLIISSTVREVLGEGGQVIFVYKDGSKEIFSPKKNRLG